MLNRGTGRRKNAIARVRLQPGEGRVTVNEKDPLAYLGRRVLEMAALAPLRVTGTQRKFDISIKVIGGGTSGQAGAIAHGIARALCRYDPDFRAAVLGNAGTLISFRVGPDDAAVLAREFQPVFGVQDLLNLPNHHIYLKLMINGTPSRPFSAVTIKPEA